MRATATGRFVLTPLPLYDAAEAGVTSRFRPQPGRRHCAEAASP